MRFDQHFHAGLVTLLDHLLVEGYVLLQIARARVGRKILLTDKGKAHINNHPLHSQLLIAGQLGVYVLHGAGL